MKKIIPFLFLSLTTLTHIFAAAEFPDGGRKKTGPITFIKKHFFRETCTTTAEERSNEVSMLKLRQAALYSAVNAGNSDALFAAAKLAMFRGGIGISPSFGFMLEAYKSLAAQGYPEAQKEYDDLINMLSGSDPKAINAWLPTLLSKPMYKLFETAVKEAQSKHKGSSHMKKIEEVVQAFYRDAYSHNDNGSFLALRTIASLKNASAAYCCYKLLREQKHFVVNVTYALPIGLGDWHTTLHQATENGFPPAILDYVRFEYNVTLNRHFPLVLELTGKYFLKLASMIDEKKYPLEHAETMVIALIWTKKGQEALRIIESFQGTPHAARFKNYFTDAMDPKNCSFNGE